MMRAVALLLLACAGSLVMSASQAAGYWLPAGDQLLRDDVTLLVDEGVIRVPTNAWPIPIQDLRAALVSTSVDMLHEPALQNALLRVQKRVGVDTLADADWRIHSVSLTLGKAGLLRDYATLGREDGEIRGAGGATNDRWSVNVVATAAPSPDDGQALRFDGSDLTLRWGNWLFSASTLERWWGPGHDGSLILSTNARPMIQLSLDRARSVPFSVPIIHWLGPWRFTAYVAALESERADVDKPLFMGMRVSFKPAQILEFGLSRTAQFCGSGRPCGLETFGNVLLGRDNAGLRVDAVEEPGNQMAGFDARIISPIKRLPLALYAQMIGEDGSSSGIPERDLGLFGAETWVMFDSGARLAASLEYSNTSCKWDDPQPNANCAYRQNIYFAGYRYRGRAIGHTTDSDSEMVSADLRLTRGNGQEWGISAKKASLDRYGGVDVYNSVTQGRGDYKALELRWRGKTWGEDLSVQIGYEAASAGARDDDGVFGFVSWQRSL